MVTMLKNKCSVWKRIKFPTFWYNCYYFTWSDTYSIQLETLLINHPSYQATRVTSPKTWIFSITAEGTLILVNIFLIWVLFIGRKTGEKRPFSLLLVCIHRVQNVFLRCPTPRLHCFLSSHWASFRFLSFMAFFIPSIQFFFRLPRALFCFGIHFNGILGSLSSAILWTWPCHVRCFCSVSFIIVSSSPICCLIVILLVSLSRSTSCERSAASSTAISQQSAI